MGKVEFLAIKNLFSNIYVIKKNQNLCYYFYVVFLIFSLIFDIISISENLIVFEMLIIISYTFLLDFFPLFLTSLYIFHCISINI